MSKKAYVGINGISKNVKNIYVGVNGVPKKVVKGYVGINGVAKLFWDNSTPAPIPLSWDFWTSSSYTTLFRTEVGNVVKHGFYITYYAAAWLYDSLADDTYLTAIILSPDMQSVTYTWDGTEYRWKNSIVDANNITWYWAGDDKRFYDAPTPNCVINTPETAFSGTNRQAQAAQAMLDKIYAIPFHEEYYRTYSAIEVPISDKLKTLRKCYGAMLFANYPKRANFQSSHCNYYDYYSNAAEGVIREFMNVIGNDNLFRLDFLYYGFNMLILWHKSVSEPFSTTIPSVSTNPIFGTYYGCEAFGSGTYEQLELGEKYDSTQGWIVDEKWTTKAASTNNPVLIGIAGRYQGSSSSEKAIFTSSNVGIDY